jgi:hypothetical protein
MLTFDTARHRYFWDGEPVPGFSGILKSATRLGADYSKVNPDVLHNAATRGNYVDECCALYDQDLLDLDRVHPEARGYVDGWIAFRKEQPFRPVAWQVMLYHPQERYACTNDVVGYYDHAADPVTFDIKCVYQLSPTYALQTAAQTMPGLVQADGTKHEPWCGRERGNVWLKKNGKYEIAWHRDFTDYDVWQGIVRTYWWGQKHSKGE